MAARVCAPSALRSKIALVFAGCLTLPLAGLSIGVFDRITGIDLTIVPNTFSLLLYKDLKQHFKSFALFTFYTAHRFLLLSAIFALAGRQDLSYKRIIVISTVAQLLEELFVEGIELGLNTRGYTI
jgi:hypothetical protein